jgi:hypothetical protein
MAEASPSLFEKVLVTGASVSADWLSPSPGKRLGWKHGGRDSVVTIAQGGHPGREMIRRLSPEVLAGRTSVIAIDFLFWDSTHPTPTPGVEALDRLIALARGAKLPLILGDIPELLPGRQPSRAALNRAIRERCQDGCGCYLIELDALHRQALREGLEVHGKRRTLSELVPDGLHLSPEAGEFLQQRIEGAIARHLHHSA